MNKSEPASLILATLQQYGLALWRRAWLLLIVAALGAGAGYLYSQTQTPMYRSSMRVMALRPVRELPGELTYWMSNPQVAQTYAQLGQTGGFTQKTIQRGGRLGFVSAFAMPESQFIMLSVQTPDPTAAVPLLEAAFEVLAEEIIAMRASRYVQMEESLTVQLESLAVDMARVQDALNDRQAALAEAELGKLEEQIFYLEIQLEAATPGSTQASQAQARLLAARQNYTELSKTRRLTSSRDPEIVRLERTLGTYQSLHNTLTVNLQNARLSSLPPAPPLLRVDEPFEPFAPYTPRTHRNIALAGLAAFGLGVILVLGWEYLNDTLKPGESLRERLNRPILGQIPVHAPGDLLPVEHNPRSPPAEAYRILRTNLAFSAVGAPMRILLVTSPGPGEGKSLTASNLASVLSLSGQKILLVDVNLRRPSLHKILDLHNRQGLSDLIRNPEAELDKFLQVYRGENNVFFSVLASGTLPPNPFELLISKRTAQIFQLGAAKFDTLVLDAPPLTASETRVLASFADGVLLVGTVRRTRVDAMRLALEQLAESRASVAGIILNKIPGQFGADRGR
jgi:capsular exopolysaccharide synthesis family protein